MGLIYVSRIETHALGLSDIERLTAAHFRRLKSLGEQAEEHPGDVTVGGTMLLEVGFYLGERALIQEAHRLNPNVRISSRALLDFTYLIDGEDKHFPILFEKKEDYVDWQDWRLHSLFDGSFSRSRFRPYHQEHSEQVSPTEMRVFSNRGYEVGESLFMQRSHVQGDGARRGEVQSRYHLAGEHQFRYVYLIKEQE